MVTKEWVADSVARVVKLLENPRLQPCPRNSVVRDARCALIAQIFWGDRVLAAMRDSALHCPDCGCTCGLRDGCPNYKALIAEYSDEMGKAYYRGEAALNRFVDCIRNKDCNGV